MEQYDFSGWATRNNLKCSDGRTILKDAFKENDGQIVPLVWNHQHNDQFNVLGHALLENREDGVYAYCKFNDSEAGQNAKLLVEHGDVSALSIYANQLKQNGANVLHGAIREVSLVLAGANPGAFIDSIMSHVDGADEEAIIYTGEEISLAHGCGGASSEEKPKKKKEIEHMAEPEKKTKEMPEAKPEMKDDEEDPKAIFDTLNEKQKELVYAMIGRALEEKDTNESNKNKEGEPVMKHNVFENDAQDNTTVLSHADVETIIADAKRYGSMKDSVLAHTQDYGIENIDYLFPEAKSLNNTPEFITKNEEWVTKVMGSVHHSPFSRIKSMFADITEDQARARGYIKGKLKKEEVFSLLKRTTTPTTVYKKQKLDRDDVVDITDFDVVAWIKAEMRGRLDVELARAYLFGDGRLSSDDDKINEQNIRPIWTDSELFVVNTVVTNAANATDEDKAKAFIKAIKKARKNYKGSGNPSLFVSEDMLTNCLLIEDTIGHPLYDTVEKLATTLRVKEIIPVAIMEGLTREVSGVTRNLDGIIVNLADYTVGADKGGAVNMFDDFDIDYNQQKYLIETRCSGALTKPYSAIVVESTTANAAG